jgi:hypothetical protein
MKKSILSISLLITLSATALFISSCSKDDTAPSITILGDNPVTISLNSAYTDAGATANDDKDGDVTSSITQTNDVDVNLTGTYTVTYTATDKAGNTGTETRTVIVKNDADYLEGTYNVSETCDGVVQTPYTETVSASSNINKRIIFSKFANYSNNTNIYANVTGTVIDLPSQTATGIGSLNESHSFSGAPGGTISGNNFGLIYTDVNNSAGGASTTCTATFVKQ